MTIMHKIISSVVNWSVYKVIFLDWRTRGKKLIHVVLVVINWWFFYQNVANVFIYNFFIWSCHKKCLKSCAEVREWVLYEKCIYHLIISTFWINNWIKSYAFLMHIIGMLHFLAFIWYTPIIYVQCTCRENQVWNATSNCFGFNNVFSQKSWY